MGIYEDLGVKTRINGYATLTRLGGSLMPPAVLEAMAAAYQKTGSYADRGTIRFHAEQEGRTVDETDPFAIAFVRPGKL